MTAWALGIGGRTLPPHPDFHIDRARIALTGYSQGGLHTNLGQVWSNDRVDQPLRDLVPRARAREHARPRLPGARAELRAEALVRGGPDRDLPGRLDERRIAPVVDKWIATAAADAPQVYGSGDLCDRSTHDTATSTMQQDLAWRSVGCQPERLGLPWLWAQAFDDGLFTPDMAISMWRRAPNRAQHRLYLSMGGHAAPAADQSVEQDKLDAQTPLPRRGHAGTVAAQAERRLLDAGSRGRGARRLLRVPGRRVAPADRGQLAAGEGRGRDVSPRRRRQRDAGLREPGTTYLSPLTEDERNDPVAAAALSGTPLGTSPLSSVPATNLPGFIASFRTPPFSSDRELSGAPFANLSWTPAVSRLAAGARAVRRGA